jgi:NAD(P)-dependent dehydrogenase (short-subunit alcohol dehydrogenase family)
MANKIWFITGISSGLGKALADDVMASGDFVIGTFRQVSQVDEFNRNHAGKGLAVQLDITDNKAISSAFESALAQFDRIDVLVNNAGVGFTGAVEEVSEEEVRGLFDANFFGTLKVTQTILPIFRKQVNGHIIQISSQAGIKSTPGFGIYNASKFALEGFSEALAAEVAPLGIKLTLVEPGPFRTNFAGGSLVEAKQNIEAYEATAGVFKKRMKEVVNGKQEGDPQKASKAIIKVVNSENPPLRLALGKIAVANISAKIASLQKDLDDYRELAESVVF